MINRQQWTRALLGILMAMTAAARADAQIGGLIKRKAADAIKGPEKKDEKPAPKPDALPGGVMEITAPVFEGVINGLKVEVALRRELRAELAKIPAQQAQYDQCLAKLVLSEEYTKIAEEFGKLPEKATSDQVMAAIKKMTDDTEAVQKKMCPNKPEDWSGDRKQKRLAEIRTKAIQAAAPVTNARGDSDHPEGPFLSGDEWVGQSPSAPSEGEFNTHLERLDKLCGLRKEKVLPASAGFQAPGSGGKFWIFTPGELSVMDDKNCKTFEDLYKELS